jgi:tRNA modification GTPase
MLSDVIVAQATPPGRSAVALLRVSGDGCHELVARVLAPFTPSPYREARLGVLRDARTNQTLDNVLYLTFEGPRSYTGEDAVEISTHGGLLVPVECLTALIGAGARLAEPGEFTRRALQNGKVDLLQAEAIGDLVDATAPAQRRAALDQLDRGLSRRIGELRTRVLSLEGLVSYEIDFPEEDDGPVPPERVDAAISDLSGALSALMQSAAEGERLKEGALAVIAGRPNAGKSSLFNALLGIERAIVTDMPGTTRDAIEAPATCGGFPFRLVDTAGLRDTSDEVEKMGVEVSWRYLDAADIVIFCAEAGRDLDSDETRFLARLHVTALMVRTKSDLSQAVSADEVVVSAASGKGLDTLRDELARRAFSSLSATGNVATVLTRERHRNAVGTALEELERFDRARREGLEMVVAATHLRAAVTALDAVIGAVVPDDVLDVVFGEFCIGK